MIGFNVSLERARALVKLFSVYYDSKTGFWVAVDREKNYSRIYRTGDQEQKIPESAFPWYGN